MLFNSSVKVYDAALCGGEQQEVGAAGGRQVLFQVLKMVSHRTNTNRLRRLVAQCRINDFIPWAKVSFYMDRRTKEQCYQRYVYSLRDSIRHGPFTDAEDMLLIIGKELYGKDWSKISEMTPCRSTSSISF